MMNTPTSPKLEYPWKAWQIAIGDALLIAVSYGLSYYLRYEVQFLRPVGEFYEAPFSPFIPYMFIYIAWMVAANQGGGLYENQRGRTLVQEAFKIVNATSNAAVVVMALSFLIRPLVFSRLMIVQAAFIAAILLILWRGVLRILRNRQYKRGVGVENVLLVGVGEIGRFVLGTLVARPDLGYRLIGFVDDDAERGTQDVGRVLALGSIDNLAKIVDQQQVDTVIITLPWSSQRRILQIIDTCERKNVNVRVVPDLVQFNMSQIEVEMLNGLPMLGAKGEVSIKRSQLISKRVLDMLITVLALPIILPVMGILALAVRLDSAGPIFFSQIRVGMNGRHFRMIKFRSMIPNAEDLQDHYVQRSSEDPEGKYERKDDDPRITKVGRWLRRTSMDELPQLINVLRGEMSLVGPRPPLPQEVALYQNWQLQRLNAPPGMTGLWQVSGRSNIPFAEKCLLDIYYIENWSLGLDLQILVQTAPQVFIGRGAY